MRKFGICCLGTAAIMVVLTIIPVTAAAVTYAQLYSARKAEENTQIQLNNAISQINVIQEQLAALKISLSQLNDIITATNIKIHDQQLLLDRLREKELIDEQKRYELIQQFNAILVSTYENGGYLNYLSILLDATSWSDFIERLQEIKIILSHNANIQQQIAQESQIVLSERANIATTMNALKSMNAQNNRMAQLKQQSIGREDSILASLNVTDRRLSEEKASQLAGINNIQRELLAQQEETRLYAKYGPIKSTEQTPVITQPFHIGAGGISSLLAYAEGYLGTPYVWGGTTPVPGFDCSGFTQYVLRHSGMYLQRTSEQQYEEGIPVSKNQLEPGDLVFFSTYIPGPSHVGIYIGDGLMIDSEDFGVVFDNINNAYWAPRYLGARRVVEP